MIKSGARLHGTHHLETMAGIWEYRRRINEYHYTQYQCDYNNNTEDYSMQVDVFQLLANNSVPDLNCGVSLVNRIGLEVFSGNRARGEDCMG